MCAIASDVSDSVIHYYLSDGVHNAGLCVGRNVIGRGATPVGAHHFICLESPRAAVSRYQAVIDVAANGDAWVRDCGSTNGTFLSQHGRDTGLRLEPNYYYMLCPGCRVTFGDVACYVRAAADLGEGAVKLHSSRGVNDKEDTEQRIGCSRDVMRLSQPMQQPPSLSPSNYPQPDRQHEKHDGASAAAAAERPVRSTNSPIDAACGADARSWRETGCTSVATCAHSAATLHATSHSSDTCSRHDPAVSELNAQNAAQAVSMHKRDGAACYVHEVALDLWPTACHSDSANKQPNVDEMADAVKDEDEDDCLLDSHGSTSSTSSSLCASDSQQHSASRKRPRILADTDAGVSVDKKCVPSTEEHQRAMPVGHGGARERAGTTDVEVVVEAETTCVKAGKAGRHGCARAKVPHFSACVSGIDGAQREVVKRAIRQHGGRVVEDVVRADMLVVTAPATRTPKFLIALGRGIPVVSEHLFASTCTLDVSNLLPHIVPMSHQGVLYNSDTIRRVIYRCDRTPLMHGVRFDLSGLSKSVRRTAEDVIIGCGGSLGKLRVGDASNAHKLRDEDVACIFDNIVQGERFVPLDKAAPASGDKTDTHEPNPI